MSFDLYAEVEQAKFLDFIENNKAKIWEFLLLEYEDLLIKIYKNHEKWGILK